MNSDDNKLYVMYRRNDIYAVYRILSFMVFAI